MPWKIRGDLLLVDGGFVDSVMVLCAFILNACMIVVFGARAHKRDRLELVAGYVVNPLLVPFAILWALNLFSGHDVGRLITGTPIVLFLVFDFWYRTLSRRKPRHHPTRWPLYLYLYVILYYVGAMLLVGYGFLVSLFDGFLVLASYYGSLAAYGYYQYRHRKARGNLVEAAPA